MAQPAINPITGTENSGSILPEINTTSPNSGDISTINPEDVLPVGANCAVPSQEIPKGLLCNPEGLRSSLSPIAGAARFLPWRAGPDPKNRPGKFSKVPVNGANRNLSGDWQKTGVGLLTLNDAIEQAQGLVRDFPDQGFGVGILTNGEVIVHSAKTGKDFYATAPDLDGVRDPETGAIIPEAQKIIDELGGYWEPSPSGRGMRGLGLTTQTHTLPDTKLISGETQWGIEVFCISKWVSLTGTGVGTLGRFDDAKVAEVIQKIRPKPANNPSMGARPSPGVKNEPDSVMAALSEDINKPVVISENRGAISSAVDFVIAKGLHESYTDWWSTIKDLRGALKNDVVADCDEDFLHSEARRCSQASTYWNEQEFEEKWNDPSIEHGRVRNLFARCQGAGWKNPGRDRPTRAGGGGDGRGGQGRDDPNLQWINDFNDKYAPVLYNTKMAVAFRDYDEGMARERWRFLPFAVFREMHCSEYGVIGYTAEGEVLTKPKGTGWLNHRRRSPNRKFYFNPAQAPALERDGYLNLWMGLNVQGNARKGDPLPMVRHLNEVIADGDPERIDYVMGWVALLIQKPGVRHEVALVLRGLKGSGKGTLGNLLCKIFGKHGIAIRQSRHLTGNFNEHLLDCCFLFADEAFFAGDKPGEAALKGLITDPTNPIEPKGIGLFDAPNRLSILMATNSDFVVPATKDERRYAVLDVSESKVGDRVYWDNLHNKWMENPDNIAAFVEYMREYDLSAYNPRAFPETDALAEQRAHNLEPWAEWWSEGLTRGSFFRNGEWYENIGVLALHESFLNYCQRHNISTYGRLSSTQLGMKLGKNRLCGASVAKHINQGENIPSTCDGNGSVTLFRPTLETGKKHRCRALGSLDEARSAFIRAMGVTARIFDERY